MNFDPEKGETNRNQDSKIKKVPYEAHPDRCQHVNEHGQCTNFRCLETNSHFCVVHGGESGKKQREYNYQIKEKLRLRLNQKTQSPGLKTLHEEVGILRILLETTLGQCDTDIDLMLQSQKISNLIEKIEKTVNSLTKLEKYLGQYLAKNDLIQIATEIISVISENITDLKILKTIGDQIQEIISRYESN